MGCGASSHGADSQASHDNQRRAAHKAALRDLREREALADAEGGGAEIGTEQRVKYVKKKTRHLPRTACGQPVARARLPVHFS